MKVGTSEPPTGMTPNGSPIAVPRSQAGVASANSSRVRKGRPETVISWACGSRRMRAATWKTSPRASTATVTVTIEIPSNIWGTPIVKRSDPVKESMPMTATPSPRRSDMSPLSTESATIEDVATKAKSARAKNSAGPKFAEKSASFGARKTTTIEAIMPPVKAPIAAVARAWGARPALAILCPSKVEAIADPCPGVFMRIAMVESPKSPPKYTPENMMNAAVGSRAKVIGSRSATAIDEPRPGSTPTAVPSRQPTTTQRRFIGVSAPAKPWARSPSWSIRSLPR